MKILEKTTVNWRFSLLFMIARNEYVRRSSNRDILVFSLLSKLNWYYKQKRKRVKRKFFEINQHEMFRNQIEPSLRSSNDLNKQVKNLSFRKRLSEKFVVPKSAYNEDLSRTKTLTEFRRLSLCNNIRDIQIYVQKRL